MGGLQGHIVIANCGLQIGRIDDYGLWSELDTKITKVIMLETGDCGIKDYSNCGSDDRRVNENEVVVSLLSS
jgi:hypothetical protein